MASFLIQEEKIQSWKSPVFSSKMLFFIVLSIHALFCIFLLWTPPFKSNAKKGKKVVVQTIQLHPSESLKNREQNSLPKQIEEIKNIEGATLTPLENIVQSPPNPPPIETAAQIENPHPTKLEKNPENEKIPSPSKPEQKKNVKNIPEKKTQTQKKEPAKKNTNTNLKKAQKTSKSEVKSPKKESNPSQKNENKNKTSLQEAKETAEMQMRKKELLAKAKEGISKMEKGSSSLPKNNLAFNDSSYPKSLGNLSIETISNNFEGETLSRDEIDYRSDIAQRLKMHVRLPGQGEVRIKLTISRAGKVLNLTVVQAKNADNRQAVENVVPKLVFSPFGENFPGKNEYSFQITLRNEI